MSLLMLKSAYEIAREERIRRNNEILRQMEIESLGENVAVAKENKEKKVKTTKKRKTKSKILPQRRSKRLKGEKADVVDTAIVVTAQKPTRRVHHRTRTLDKSHAISITSLEHHTHIAQHQRSNTQVLEELVGHRYKRLMERHAKNGVKLPPNATYRHTVHRVLSMSEKALSRRVRVIENARGKYAVLKMRMFAEVLILEGYDDIAAEASASLERLILKLPKYKESAKSQKHLYEKVVSTTK